MSDKPEACTNCHIMSPQYATWSHSSHREVAHCNDCHVPHNNVFNKYYFKAKDGLRHSTIFTLRKEPQVIFILDEGAEVVHNNCIRCHSKLLKDPKLAASVSNHDVHMTDRKCWEYHREVPHGRVNSGNEFNFENYGETPLVGMDTFFCNSGCSIFTWPAGFVNGGTKG